MQNMVPEIMQGLNDLGYPVDKHSLNALIGPVDQRLRIIQFLCRLYVFSSAPSHAVLIP